MGALTDLSKTLLRTTVVSVLFSVLIVGCGFFEHPVQPTSTTVTEVERFNVYYGDLHTHSDFSGGLGTADEAYRYARDSAGLDFFSLADHDYGLIGADWNTMRAGLDYMRTLVHMSIAIRDFPA